ncbi:uncharacterized protein L969DRAFT_113419 [Mixia osmundae IAM 14324]|uniref:uncharacterized protein n=1 Tax=Mixia osmundae (strain CBS 9802 / IAM 14324 / JCM 22182 / KY 12970) TaxID=764103 RepID=UPI0004A557C1|nr:uncharacterized protein L969DRAFT_113419 [Mixia osmundae IAM 14324]KEI41850.1 hypothetical protein L969DRAFT_113419 [Mixia osmundae IAM 14324]
MHKVKIQSRKHSLDSSAACAGVGRASTCAGLTSRAESCACTRCACTSDSAGVARCSPSKTSCARCLLACRARRTKVTICVRANASSALEVLAGCAGHVSARALESGTVEIASSVRALRRAHGRAVV